MKKIVFTLALCAAFISGYVFCELKNPVPVDGATPTQEEVVDKKAVDTKPAYLLAMANILDLEKLGPYRAVAEPLAKKAGYHVIASGHSNGGARLLEGECLPSALCWNLFFMSLQFRLTKIQKFKYT